MQLDVDLNDYVTCPLLIEEVVALERRLGQRLPDGFREFLLTVGVPQSLDPTIIQNAYALVRKQDFWPGDGFVFAEPGEGIMVETPAGPIVEAVYGESWVAYPSFDAYLDDSIVAPEDPDSLAWTTQLSFSTRREGELLELLRKDLARPFDLPWERVDVSPAGVHSYQKRCTGHSGPFLKRMDYLGWETPIYSLNHAVPPEQIRKLRAQLLSWNDCEFGFRLVDYGLLPRDL